MVTQRGRLLPLLTIHILFATTLCDVSHLKNNNEQTSRLENESHYHGQDGNYDLNNDGTGWDIRLSVPGEPERDYPVLNNIPTTSFNCVEKKSGYYADTQTRCQVFRVCAPSAPNGYFSFLCPNGTLFNQQFLVCDWWMNVKCVDTERYMDKNNYVSIKSGSEMMSDIEKMITFPMNNPYTTILSNTKTVDQTYNPPSEMFEFMQNAIQSDMAILDSFKLPGPNAELSQNKVNKDSYSSGTSFLGHSPLSKKFEGAIPKLPNNLIYGSNLPQPFTTSNFAGLNLQNQLNLNTKSIKVTKQQFTYPSQYDREYTLTIPKLDTNSQFGNTDTNSVSDQNYQSFQQYKSLINNNASSSSYLQNNIHLPALTNIPKALPLIVLFLQPPLESVKSDASSSINQSDNSKNTLTTIKNIKSFPNNESRYTTNLASQTNYYITNNYSKPKTTTMQPTIDPDVETLDKKITHSEPARLTLENASSNNIAINMTMRDTSTTNTTTIQNVSSDMIHKIERDNDLVTLFSAHIIPAGDVNKQKVLKICIPKDMLSYLVHLHNSTKAAFFKSYQNEINSYNNNNNTSIHIQGQPLIKRIMENFFIKNQSLNLQVPNQSEETFYNQQQNPDGYFRNGIKFNANSQQIQFTNNEPIKKTQQTTYSSSENISGNLKAQLSHYEESSKIQHNTFMTSSEIKNTSSQYNNNNNVISASQVVSIPSDSKVKTENKLFYVNQQSAKLVPISNGEFYSTYQHVYKQTPNVLNNFNVNSTHNLNQVKSVEQRNSTFNFQRTGTESEKILQTNRKYQNNYVGNIVYADKQTINNQNQHKSTQSSSSPNSQEISQYIYTHYKTKAPSADLKSESEQKISSNIQNDEVKTIISSKYTAQNDNNIKSMNNNEYQQISVKHPTIQTLQYGYHEKNSNQINNNSIRHETRFQNIEQHNSGVNMYQKPIPISPSNLPPHLLINFDNLNQNNRYVNAEVTQEHKQENQYPTKSVVYQMSSDYTAQNDKIRNDNVQQPRTDTVYTTVEVVPALGFSLNSEQERRHYYSVLAGNQKANYNAEQQIVMYPSQTYATQEQPSFVRSNHYDNRNAYAQNRNVHGHVIAHVTGSQPDNQRQSLPLENFGYPREKPNVSFVF